jgi:diguanylate cyclase (GGDEF)-like protein
VSGSSARPTRPILLILVFGAFLAIVGVTASAQSVLVGSHLTTAMVQDLVNSDAATIRAFVNAYVRPAHLAAGSDLGVPERTRLERLLATLPRTREILRVELHRPDGSIVAASEPGRAGIAMPTAGAFSTAAGGAANAAILPTADAAAGPGALGSPTVLREFLPLTIDGHVLGIVAVWRDGVPIVERLDALRRDVVVVTLTAALVASAALFAIFRSTQARLSRQTAALLDSTRRDALTGLLNHGALVERLAEAMESARAAGRPLGIALIDLDSFRLLNDHHGHEAGDAALTTVAGSLERSIGGSVELGRYGPDEFLLIAPSGAVADLEPIVEHLRTALVDVSLQFEETERLPITVSVGIATYPNHATSVTALLAAAVQVLEEAKASGGDAVRIAADPQLDAEGASAIATFDVLQGLVIAVDTKDRYTKRHSDDVARYGAFLGQRLGLSEDDVRILGTAGLLHDVGKIGIPDQILRKPGALTEAEYDIVKQHVALGDMIVRDLPDIDAIRGGIRHHHERWDGRGYLDRLEGEAIPLIARILAVADAFSAMTTTRPYRKALGVDEALRRLGDGAGTQLEERLVAAFIEGIEHDPAPPLPGEASGVSGPWMPRRRVA